MRRLLLLALLLLPLTVFGQSGQYSIIRPRATTPATCSTTEGAIYWDTIALEIKVCTATNTWSAVSGGGGSGTVTSVAISFAGGLITVGGTNPITSNGTIALTVAGTSGGIPYFDSSASWLSSGALTAGMPVLGGGAGAAPTVGTISGNTTKFVTTTGTLTNGDCVSIDPDGNFVDAGVPGCGGGGGGGSVTSVSLAAPTGFPVTGNPIIGSGTLAWALPTSWNVGSLLLGDGANSAATLLIGTSGKVLTSDGTTASWQPAGSASVGPGTQNFMAKFNNAPGTTVGDSSFLSETANNLSSSGNLALPTNTISFSATPVFDASKTFQTLTLTGNVTSSTVSNAVTGEFMEINLCQDGTGGRTFVWPTSFKNTPPVQSTASQCTRSLWRWDGTSWTMPAEVAMSKPPMLDSGSNAGNGGAPICYAAPWGNDNNDGLSWGSAKNTVIEGCYDALPSKGGSIYIARATKVHPSFGQGIWLMSINDPNYASPPTGWRHVKDGPVLFSGVAGDNQGGLFDNGSRVSLTNCGTFADNNHPCIWLANASNLVFENLFVTGGRAAVLGEFSNGTGRSGDAGVNTLVFKNDYFGSAGTNTGPAVDCAGYTFWTQFIDSAFSSNPNAVSSDDITGAAILDSYGSLGGGCSLIVRHSIFNGGGGNGSGSWMIYPPSGNSFAIGENLETEANNRALIWIRNNGGIGGFMGAFKYLLMSDSTHQNTPAFQNDNSNSKPDQITVEAVQIDNTSICPVQGPTTLIGAIGPNSTTVVCPPLAQGQQGQVRGRLIGQEDTSRRNLSPVIARFTNLASQVVGTWGLSAGGSVSLVTAPDGTTLAGKVQSSSGNVTSTFYSTTRALNTGDMIVGGCWVRSEASPSSFGGAPCRLSTAGGSPTFSGSTSATTAYNGGNEWQWIHTSMTVVNSSVSTTISWVGFVDATHPVDFYAPVLNYIPAGTITPTELAEYEWRVSSYPNTASVGDVSMLRGQRFSFGSPGSTFFGKFQTPPLTADRIYTWPDTAGTVALTSQLPGVPVYDNFSTNDIANYTTGGGGLTINTGTRVVTGNASNAFGIWNANTFLNDQFAQAKITNLTGVTGGTIIAVTARSLGYICGETTTQIRLSGGSLGTLTSTITGAVGDVLRITAVGSTITCTQNPGSSSAVSVSGTDSTTTVGAPGMYFSGTNGSFGNFSGGSIPPYALLNTEQDWISAQHFLGGFSINKNGFQDSIAGTFTANRTTTLPDATGTVGVITGSSPANNDCAKFIVAGGVTTLGTAGSACGSGGGGSGTVTSVDMTVPSWLAVTGVPVISASTIAITAATGQTAHKVIGTGATASFAPVSLTTLDLPFTYSGNTSVLGTTSGSFTAGHTVVSDASGNLVDSGTTGGTGTVTSFSAGTLSPLFTTSVATATSTPALSFALSTAAAHTTFMNNTGSTATPGFQSIGVADLPFTYSGNTTKLATTTGALTNGNCVSIDASGNLVDAGGLCGGGGGGGSVTSVGFIAPTGFTVTNQPVISAADITLAMPSGWTTGDLLLGNGSNSVSRLAIGTNGLYLKSNGSTASWAAGGTINSLTQTFTGGLISVSGSPVTTSSGTLALTVAGTSGGIPYFSSSSTWASSAALTANLPVIGGGAGVAPTVGTRTGNTTKFATSTGTLTNGDCVTIDANGNFIDSGAACGGSGGLPGGTDTAIQVNHPLNTFFGDATNFNYNTSTHKVTTTGDVSAANLGLLAGGVVSSADTGTPAITFSSSAVSISGTGSPADFVSIPVYTPGSPAIVSVEAAGSDADISLNLVSKGTGHILANGVPINANTWIYVTSYGDVGNSSTGDDVTLQTAIDACPATGCTLLFPAGTYYVAGTNATITNVAQTLFSVTFTATNTFTVGDYVTVSGMSDGTLNGLFRITSRTGSQFIATGAISQTVVSGAMSGTATRGLMARTPFIEFKGVGFPGRDTGAPSMIKSTTGANPMYLLAVWPMASANGPKVSQLGFQDATTSKILMGGLLIVNSNSLEVDNNLFFNFTCGGKTEGTDVGYGCGTGLTLSGGGDTGQTTGFTQWGTVTNNSVFLSKRGIATRANVASITFTANNIQCYLTASPVTGSIGMDMGDTFGRNYSASALGVPSEMYIFGTQIQNCDVGLAGYNLHHGIWGGKSELLGAVIGRASTIGARIDGTSTSLTGYADLNWASVGYDKGISVVANTRQLNIIKQSMTSNTLDLSVSDDAVSVPLTGFGYTANKVAQVAAITDTAMQASTSVDSVYRFNGEINCTTASAAATATLNLKYFDTSNTAQTVSTTATCTTLGASSVGSISNLIREINGHSITYGVTIVNTPTYDVSVRLEQK